MEAVAGQVARHKSIVARLVKLISEGHAGKVDKRGANQEILQRLADIVIAVYGAESAMGRALRARADGTENADLFETMTRVYAARAAGVVARSAGEAAGLMEASGAEIGGEIEKIRSLAVAEPCDAIGLRRQVAEAIIGREGVWFN